MKDVIDLLELHNIPYIDKGENLMVSCLNPCHEDNSPSMSIRKSDGLFNCFSCGYKGNLYTLNKLLNADFTSSSNKSFRRNFPKRETFKKPPKKKIITPTIKVVGNLLDINTNPNEEVITFLDSIGFTKNFVETFNIKYSTYTEMISVEKFVEEFPTKIRNRICIPIYHNNKLINYECRTFVGDTPKVVYAKGCKIDTLFNWENINKNKTVIVTESIKNLAKIWQVNKNVVSMFHAIPTERQMKLLNECENILLFLDNDKGAFGETFSDGRHRKGGLESFADRYKHKDFKLCYDKRTYKKIENGKEKICGYDANDCTLNEIKLLLQKAIWYSEWKENKRKKMIW